MAHYPFDTNKLVEICRQNDVSRIGRRVDLLTEAAISPYLRDTILNDLQVLYEA